MRVLLLAGVALITVVATATANEPVISLQGAATAAHWTAAQRAALAPQFAILSAKLDGLAAKEAAERGAVSARLTALHARMRTLHGNRLHGGTDLHAKHGAGAGDVRAHHEALVRELASDPDLAEMVALIHAMMETMDPAQRDAFCAYLHGRITTAGLVTAGASGER